MAPEKPKYFERVRDDYRMDFSDFVELEDDVFSESVVFSDPEQEFISTVDEWWADFLSDVMS